MNVRETELQERIDPHLTAENLDTLASRALGRTVESEKASVLTGGCWNRVVGVTFTHGEDELVIKISPNTGDKGFEREFLVLRYFKEHTELPVPEALLADVTGDLLPGSLLIMRRVPGTVMHHIFGRLTAAMRRSVSEQIGHSVGRLHNTRSTGFGGVEAGEDDRLNGWSEFWLPRFDKAFADISQKNLLDPAFLRAVDSQRPGFADILALGSTSTLTHYDIWSGNVMLDTVQGEVEVTGYIDVPGHWADYARELSFMEMFGVADEVFYDVYRSYHPLDETFHLRTNLYNLKMHMRHIMMYPDQGYYRQGAQECLSFLQNHG